MAEGSDVEVMLIVGKLKEAGTDISKQIPALLQLGEWYEKKAKITANGADFAKANALFNAALVRTGSVSDKIHEDEIRRRITDLYRGFLCTFAANDEISRDEIRSEILSHKKFLADNRRSFCQRLDDINSRFDRNDKTINFEKEDIFKIHADEMQVVFQDIQDMYVKFVGMLVKECESRLGKAPCEYALIALGSVARMEATPFSDLEFAILYSGPAIEDKISYFRTLSHFLHLKVINLGETILPALGIEQLNDFQSSDPSTDWFYDLHTPRGISFDGAMPWASKTALGRMATKDKPALELIQTPEKMAELQDEKVAPKEGYHLADIMTRAVLLYGENALLDEYNERVAEKLNAKYDESIYTVGFIRGFVQLMLDTATYNPHYSYLGQHCTVGALFDAKKQFYRLISLLLSDLGLIFDVRSPSPWEVISALHARGIISSVAEMTNIKICLSLANEIRLKTYFANNGQKELLSPVPHYANTSEQSTDSLQHPIFRFFDEDVLVRLLSSSNDMHQRCHEFCSRIILHNEIDIRIFQNSSVPSSTPFLLGTLYYRLQNFPKALEWMKSEQKESKNYSICLNGQGMIYNEYGEYDKALKCFESALEAHDENEESDLNVFSCLDNLGLTLLYLGQYEMAKIRLQEAIETHKEIYGEGFEQLASSQPLPQALSCTLFKYVGCALTRSRIMQNLGLTYHELGDLTSAIETFKKVQEMQDDLTDMVPDSDIIHLNLNMASSYTELDEHAKSLDYVKQALQRSKKLFGEHDLSSELVQIYINAATVYEHCNMNNEALALYIRGVDLLNQVYGDIPHPGKISCFNNLGNFFSRRYQTGKAVENLERALEQARCVYKKPHFTVAVTLNNLGVALKRAEKSQESLPYFQEALEIMNQILGEEHVHPTTSDILNNMGTIYQDLGTLNEAYQCYKEVLKMNTAIYGDSGHDAIATVCSNIACVSEELGDLVQAKEYYTKAVDIDRKVSSTKNTSPGLVSSLYGLSSICDELGDEEEALKHLEEAREVAKSAGSKSVFVATVLLELGMKYNEMDSVDKSKMCFQEAREMGESLAKDDSLSPSVLELLEILKNFKK